MAKANLKNFAKPDILKSIRPENLVELLGRYQEYFAWRGCEIAADAIDYEHLAGVLRTPDETAPAELVETLHVIGAVGIDSREDELREIASRQGISAAAGDLSSIDLAAQIWLQAPEDLLRMEKEQLFERRRKFESYPAGDSAETLPLESLPDNLAPLEQVLGEWYREHDRGYGCRIIRSDADQEARFLVQHGRPCHWEPTWVGVESAPVFYRPEKTDIVIYDAQQNELKVNAGTRGEMGLYVAEFGRHLFGDPNRFQTRAKYSLEALRQGMDALVCRDVPGIEQVVLREIRCAWPDRVKHIEVQISDDLFATSQFRFSRIADHAKLLKAVFQVTLTGVKKPVNVTVEPPNSVGFGQGNAAALIERWLRARGFIVSDLAFADAETDTTVAVA